jgi:ABC-type phosphate transport system substrate-binding protein
MLKLHHYLLASASLALVGYAGLASQADAAATCAGKTNCSLGAKAYTFGANDIFGGGSTLIGPYWNQMANCYGAASDLVIQTTNTAAPSAVDTDYFLYTGTPKQTCATTQVNTSATVWYINAGSGNGIGSFFGHDPVVKFGEVNTHAPTTFPEEIYSNSDTGLSDTPDVACYNNGSCTEKVAIGAPGTACSSTSPYPVPAQCYGPLIQVPVSVDDVALLFNPVYEKVVAPGLKEVDYKFRTATIKLSRNTVCGIFEGTITNWNDPAITKDNTTSLKSTSDPTPTASWSVPLIPVGRTDGSGTTSIVTRHLAAYCGSSIYTIGTSNVPAAVAGAAWNPATQAEYPGAGDVTGKITTATGSTGVAYYTAFTVPPNGFGNKCSAGTVLPAGYGGGDCIQQGRLGYAGADYSALYNKTSKAVSVSLDAVQLQNKAGKYIAAGPAGAIAAFTSGGGSPPAAGTTAAADPGQWVQGLSSTVPLADPVSSTSYPMVGTTQTFLYQCYANAAKTATVLGMERFVYTNKTSTDSKLGILAKVGLAPLPTTWLSAINTEFIVGNADGLNVQTVTGSGGGNCDSTVHTMLVGG